MCKGTEADEEQTGVGTGGMACQVGDLKQGPGNSKPGHSAGHLSFESLP